MWVPLGLTVSLDDNGQVNVTNLDNAYEVGSRSGQVVGVHTLVKLTHSHCASSTTCLG